MRESRRTPNPQLFQVLGFTPTLGQVRVATALANVGCVKMKYLWDHQMQSWRDLPSLYIRTHPTNVINMDSMVSSISWAYKAFDGVFELEDWVKKVICDMPIELVWVHLISIVFMNLMTTINSCKPTNMKFNFLISIFKYVWVLTQ